MARRMATWLDTDPDPSPGDDYATQVQTMLDYLTGLYPTTAISTTRNGDLVRSIDIDGITDTEMAERITDLQERFPALFGLSS